MAEAKADDIWAGDLLERQADARFLIRFLTRRIEERGDMGRTRSYVLNLNSEWGQGKTWFLTRLRSELESRGFLSAYVNAWRDDHADTPLIAVMAEIETVINPYLAKKKLAEKAWQAAKSSGTELAAAAVKGIGKQLAAKLATAEVIEEITTAVKDAGLANADDVNKVISGAIDTVMDQAAESVIAEFRRRSRSIDTFRSQLAKLLQQLEGVKQRKLPLFVLVDELDRCRPTYAISLLEQVKHLFEVDNVVFVIATDSEQLAHSIKAAYGSDFDSKRYLLRFFDRTYAFAEPVLDQYARYLFQRYSINESLLRSPAPKNDHIRFIADFFKAHKLSVRDLEQCFEMIRTFLTLWDSKAPVQLIYLLPLIVSHHLGDRDLFDSLTRSKAADEYRRKVNFTVSFGGTASTNYVELLDRFLSNKDTPLHRINRSGESGTTQYWVGQQFGDEFALLHQNLYHDNQPPHSVVREYPALIRSISRLRSVESDLELRFAVKV